MAALRTAGPGTEIIFQANAEYSSSYSSFKSFFASPLCLAFSSLNHTGMLQKTFCMGRIRLNLTESA